ncbi:MAG: class I SAM-dependent methyltransferase [Rhizonema sp. PD37]|nr:class I SAM-dependent methyltransferase [Rhizonema sp. PD37]
MKIAIKADNPLEAVALSSGLIPSGAILPVLSMGVSSILITAMRLNVFDHLHNAPMKIAALATATNCDVFGMEVLLEGLYGFGFVERNENGYRLTKDSARYLTESGDKVRRDFVYFFLRDVSRNLEQLEHKIRTGEQSNFHFSPPSSDCWSNYLKFLEGNGQRLAPKIAKWAKFNQEPQTLLDVAGGPAQYSIAFCQKYPNLKASIIELPETVKYGTTVVEKVGLSDRIRYITGNLLEPDWGTNYDVILLFNILHNLTTEQCEFAVQQAFQSLRSGGTLLIEEPFHPGNQGKLSAFGSFISLVYFAMSGTRTWPKPVLKEWVSKAGFTKVRTSKWQLILFMSAEKP